MKNKRGFCLIENIIYIFISMIIMLETINLCTLVFKCYSKNRENTIKYNDIQNYYLYLNEVVNKENNTDIKCLDNSITFIKRDCTQKVIIRKDDKVVVKTYKEGKHTATNVLVEGIENMEVKEKGKLIYLIINYENGDEYIACI